MPPDDEPSSRVSAAERFQTCHQEVDRVLEASASMEEAAAPVLAAIGAALGWPAVELFLLNDTSGELRPAGQWSAAGPIPDLGAPGRAWRDGTVAWTLRSGTATLAVPVLDGSAVIGVLTCHADGTGHDETLLSVLVQGIAARIGAFVTLRRADSLRRELVRMQDDFLGLVGHELRTPLASIAAHIDILNEDRADYDADSRLMIESMSRNIGQLHGIVSDLLDLAGLESGQLPLAIAEVDLTALVAVAAEAAAAEARRQRLTLHVDAEPGVVVAGDGRRLRQVVDQLLANAVAYSKSGGPVRLVLSRDHDVAQLGVADEGIGIPGSEGDRVVDRFFRGSNVRHHGITGSGLGLSITRTVVRLHGGTLGFRPRRPSGTEVTVRLPIVHDAGHVERYPRTEQ